MEIKLLKNENNNDKEMLEMILQYLYENKYENSVKQLESKANLIFDQKEIQELKNLLVSHNFDSAILYLEKSNQDSNTIQKKEVIKFLKTRKFFEMIKSNTKESALSYLRSELTKIYEDIKILNKLSILLFQNQMDFEKNLNQNFHEIINDDLLLTNIQTLLCMTTDSNGNRILPSNRLEILLKQYTELSVDLHKVTKENQSNNFEKNFIIEKHDDEVWLIEFSKEYFSTSSRNGNIAIFKYNISNDKINISCINSFSAHRKYLTSMKWNENSLLTASADKSIKLWDPIEGKCIKTFLLHSDIVTSICWLNSDTFISGSIDKKMLITHVSNRVLCSETFLRIREIILSKVLGIVVIIPASLNDIIFYNYKEFKETNRIQELDPIISSSLSKSDDGRYLIVNVSRVNASINLYDLTTFELVNKFYGHIQEQYMIRCGFAGSKDEYIVSGSEDASIYIWHRSNSAPLYIIKGHTGSVNDIEWLFDSNISFLCSVSDDHTLRIWANSKVEINYNDLTLKNKGNEDKLRTNFNEFLLDCEMNHNSEEDVQMNEERSQSDSES